MFFYKLSYYIILTIYRILFRIEIKGREHLPQSGAMLVCANHISLLDPPMLEIAVRRQTRFMAKEELFKIPILGQLIRSYGAFPVKRGAGDRQALRKSLEILQEGQTLGIFPEGTRSKTGEVLKGHTGVGMFALRTDAQVVPLAIIGPYRLFRKVKVVIGPVINMDDLKQVEKVTSEEIRIASERIMEHIAELVRQNR